jgi:branched-chain amino acid transport system substrate-binding protein
MQVSTKAGGALCAALIALTLGACGSSSKSSSSTASPASSPSAARTPRTSGPEFTLGAICSCTGAQVASTGQAMEGIKVWADSVNAAGGINGHQVKLISADDAGNAATALQDVKQMVQVDHIQGLVDGSFADGTFATYIATAGVPVIGGYPVSPSFISNADFIAEGATLPVNFAGLATLAKAAGKKKLGALYCAEAPVCAESVPLAKGTAALAGLGFIALSVSSSAPSYTAPCLVMKNAGVDALFIATNGAIIPRIMDACAQQGYRPALLANMGTVLPTWITDPNLTGALIVSPTAAISDTTNPGVAAYLAAVKKYDPSLASSPQLNATTLWMWTGGKLFEAAAKAGNLTPSATPAEVKAAIYRASGTTLGALTAPLPLVPGQPVVSACNFDVTITHSKLTNLYGGKPSCLTKAQLTALLAGLKRP